jgi:type II secretory pathway component PulC
MEPASLAESGIMSGLMQGGFAVLCLIILAILFWTIKQLISLITKNNSIVAKFIDSNKDSTQASKDLKIEVKEEMQGVKLELKGVQDGFNDLEKELLKRPCIQTDRGM